jgi:hypothetical protein
LEALDELCYGFSAATLGGGAKLAMFTFELRPFGTFAYIQTVG